MAFDLFSCAVGLRSTSTYLMQQGYRRRLNRLTPDPLTTSLYARTHAHMPSRNVYVSETDVALFERAAQLAGGLSPAVAAALRLYVAHKEETMTNHDLDLVELDVSEGALTTRKRFRGSRLLSFNQSHGLRTVTWSIYRTQRHQYAVYVLDAPDWSSMAAAGDSAWEDPRTWSDAFYRTKDKTLRVFPTLDEMLRELPDDVGAALPRMLTDPEPSDLDI